jgi:hypothetical protein
MRKFLITTLLALAGLFPVFAMNEDDGHVLTDLWSKYEEARKADRPQKEAEILAEIRQKAQKQHLPVDFYDAATKYVNTVQRRDWKQLEALKEELKKEVERFNDPVVTFLWMREWKRASSDQIWAYVEAHAKDFKGNHPALHRGVDTFLNGALKSFIRSDKEFALWNLLAGRRFTDDTQDVIYKALKAELKGSYPGDGALEYYVLSRKYNAMADRPKKQAGLQALQNQYFGKAMGLFPEAALMLLQKEDMDESKADERQYRALDAACQRFEARRKAFEGDEATLAKACTGVTYLMGRLEEEELDIRVDTSRILVLFKNLYHANLTIREGKKAVKTWKVANFDRSFYVEDTVSIDLPELPDGEYTIEAVSGKHIAQNIYTQYTLSMATRQDALGQSVYVTDYKTGQPLPVVSFRLLKGDTEVANSSLRMNGFTQLPEAFTKQMDADKRSYYRIQAVYEDRRSQPMTLGRDYGTIRVDNSPHCNIYLDRGAYNPGDTVKFKAVLYNGDPYQGFKVCKGKKVDVVLEDSEDNEVGQLKLTTNDWGSISGQFVIPTGLRGGWFTLSVNDFSTDFRVDEFVLPTFDLTFDTVRELYLPGSEVPVSGTVRSYSGHSLSGARVNLRVEYYGNVIKEEEQVLNASGEFQFKFPAQSSGSYYAYVKVTDSTGETLEFTNFWFVADRLYVDFDVLNAAKADINYGTEVITTKQLKVKMEARSSNFHPVVMPVSYKLLKADGTQLLEGTVPSGEALDLILPGSGLYTLKATVSATMADGTVIAKDDDLKILCVMPEDSRLPSSEVKHLFLPGNTELKESENIEARIGTGRGRAYAVVTLFGEKRSVLLSKQLVVEDGGMDQLQIPYLDSYPDVVRLVVFYFQNGGQVHYDWVYRRVKDKYTLPLSFTRFQDKAYPGTLYTFTVKTEPGVEALVAAWDKSLETIYPNRWNLVSMREQMVDYIPFSATCGVVGFRVFEDRIAMAANTKSAPILSDALDVMEVEGEALEETVVAYGRSAPEEGVAVRSNFSSALTFQPHLHPSADGTLEFSFRTSDKLSTYYVRVYAHDKDMHNALCEKEMVVSLPVKVSLQEPRCLYVGDVYEAAVTVSSAADKPISGVIMLKAGESVQQIPVTVNPGATETKRFPVKPGMTNDVMADSIGHLVLTASFVAPEFSDAVQVTVPVYPAAQVLTEAHSAVLRDAMSREALLAELRSRFVNVPASDATLKEITVLDMVKDAIPSHVEPSADDVLSLSEAWYIGLMASVIPGYEGAGVSPNLLEKILACQNGDGGFAWFPGMKSNAIITAVLLERFALLRDRGFEVPDMDDAINFLDNKQFGTTFPVWNGWVTDAQYMRVRALYPEVPFEVKPVSATDKKRLAEFKKYAKDYLTPSKKDGRGLEGQILSKARRLLTLRSLNASAQGKALASAWGIGLSSKLEKSMRADVKSLLEYAVEHRDGGWYYPNAVMPYRGLLESEAYAHALLCQLLQADSPVITDGIRLWLMLQKETQKWDTEPAFIDAITAILDGSEAVLNTRVLALSATYEALFENIQASGNGFTVERNFYKLTDQWEPLLPGETVAVGDKIKVVYNIWNAENRSFVKLTAGREASLRPVEQLSGYVYYYGGYRHVKASATEFYFDSYPEEKTELTEEFFVTQAGRFVAPVTVIESLYAPHYRANSAFRPPLSSTDQ